MYKFVIGCILIFLVSCSTNKVCRNPEGQEVDWYTIFLMPSSASSDRQIHYGYFDSKSTDIKYYKYMESNFPQHKLQDMLPWEVKTSTIFFGMMI